MKMQLVTAGILLAAFAASARECVWTGAADDGNKWMTSGNWTENAVPGSADTAVFGAMAGKTADDAVTIDLTDMVPIGGLRIENANAPSYRFGTGTLTKQDKDSPYNFKLVNGSDEKHPVEIVIASEVRSDQTIAVFWHPSGEEGKTKNYSVYFAISNGSTSATLALEKISRYESTGNHAAAQLHFYGVGGFRVGTPTFTSGNLPCPTFDSTGKVVFDTTSWYGTLRLNKDVQVELAEGAKFGQINGTRPFSGYTYLNGDITFDGLGKFWAVKQLNQDPPKNVGGDINRSGVLALTVGKKIVSRVGIDSDGKAPDRYLPFLATGSASEDDWGFYQEGDNNLPLAVHLYGKARFGAKMIGRNGCVAAETSVGRGGEIVFMHAWSGGTKDGEATTVSAAQACDAVLAYTGDADETIDRVFFITNSCADAVEPVTDGDTLARVRGARATLRTEGQGALVLDAGSSVRVVQGGARFTFDAHTAPITFNGTFPSGTVLAVAGEKLVTLGADAKLPAGLSVTLAGGVFLLNGKAGIAVESDDNTVVVSGARTLSGLPDLPAGATLDFTLPTEDDTVTVTGATEATAVPDAITVNGRSARFVSGGRLVECSTRWKAAESGLWSNGQKWNNGVPAAGVGAIIAATGADYIVTMNEVPETMPDKVEVGQGTADYVATLSVQADLSAKPSEYEISAGGVLEVGADGALGGVGETTRVTAQPGGEVHVVSGGRLQHQKTFEISTGDWFVEGSGGIFYSETEKGGTLRLWPSAAGGSVSMTFDISDLETNGASAYYQGTFSLGNCAGGSATMNFIGRGSTNKDPYSFYASGCSPYTYSVGYQNGLGVFNVTNAYLTVGNYGFFVGTADTALKAAQATTGIVNQVDSYVYAAGSGAPSSERLEGVIVGSGEFFNRASVDDGKVKVKGVWNLESGTLNNRGYLIVGDGIAEGEFHQHGGKVLNTTSVTSSLYTNHLNRTLADERAARTFCFPVLIGFQGGKGLYEITGGMFEVSWPVFVAGCFSDEDIPYGISKDGVTLIKPDARYFPYDHDSDAVGCLRVKGGEVKFADACTVGKGGEGTIEMVGANGSLSVGTLILTNAARATARFVYDPANPANGVSPIKVTDRLVLDDATLEVDLGDGKAKRRVKLFDVDPDKIEGQFGTVRFTGEGHDQASLVRGPDGLYARVASGIVLIVR